MSQLGSELPTVCEDLISLLEKSHTTLSLVARKLEEEFSDRFADVGVSFHNKHRSS